MADANVSQAVLDINDPQFLITERFHGKPAILSTQVAGRFLRRHNNVLRDIATLRSILPKSFDELNFGRVAIKDKKGEKRPAYLLTRDAFALLVMGFTGKTAVMWKIRYIEAFNALEAAVQENHAALAREAGYRQGLDEARSLPAMQAERKAGYLEGMKEGQRLQKRRDGLTTLVRIHGYLRKGLSYAETGKLIGLSKWAVAKRVQRARALGVTL